LFEEGKKPSALRNRVFVAGETRGRTGRERTVHKTNRKGTVDENRIQERRPENKMTRARASGNFNGSEQRTGYVMKVDVRGVEGGGTGYKLEIFTCEERIVGSAWAAR
jgi:hypothetical protein